MTQYRDDMTVAVERAFAEMDLNTPVEQVIRRADDLRRRRRALTGGLALSALAVVALAVPLSLKAQGGEQGTNASVIPADRTTDVQVDLAAWSVHTHSDGTVTITVRQMSDPDGLRDTLAKAGVPAVVSARKAGQPASCSPGGDEVPVKNLIVSSATSTKPGITIRPSAMPKGAKLLVDIELNVSHHVLVRFAALEGASSSC